MDYFLFNFSGVQFHYTMSQAKIEMGLALMAVNLRKYMQHTAAA